jgi:hypothetical protein
LRGYVGVSVRLTFAAVPAAAAAAAATAAAATATVTAAATAAAATAATGTTTRFPEARAQLAGPSRPSSAASPPQSLPQETVTPRGAAVLLGLKWVQARGWGLAGGPRTD